MPLGRVLVPLVVVERVDRLVLALLAVMPLLPVVLHNLLVQVADQVGAQ